jgi:hypothetical protein
MIPALLHRHSSKAQRTPATTRTEVCPPQAPRVWQRIACDVREWLASGWSPPALPPGRRGWFADTASPTPMALARRDFVDALEGVRSPAADGLTRQICGATTMRELWHLRPEVFALVTHAFDQLEANRRLAQLNRHFPMRPQRSGFAALDTELR